MSTLGPDHEISTLECNSCSCNLPFKFFSKSQIKKVQAGKPGRCEPCTAGIPGPSLPSTPMARPEDGYCLTMHQPWASLVVAGIKRLEGRSWLPQNFTHGTLWIHSAAKEPDPEDVELVEAQYKQLLAVDGPAAAADPVFPAAYPTRCLLGCVDVAAVLSSEELQRLNLTKSLRMESEADYVFLCQSPKHLVLPRGAVSGDHKVWRLHGPEAKMAATGLAPAEHAVPVDFRALFPREGCTQTRHLSK